MPIFIQRRQILAYRTTTTPVIIVIALSLVTRISFYDAGIYRKAFTADQSFGKAAYQHRFEQLAKGIAFAESTMPVLGKGGVLRYLAFQTRATEPAAGQIELHFLAQSPLRAETVAVTHDQHAQHHLGVDRGSAGMAVVRGKAFT